MLVVVDVDHSQYERSKWCSISKEKDRMVVFKVPLFSDDEDGRVCTQKLGNPESERVVDLPSAVRQDC